MKIFVFVIVNRKKNTATRSQ